MDEADSGRSRRHRGGLIAVLLLLAALVALAVGVFGNGSTPTNVPQPATTATTAPPFTPAPYVVTDRTTLTVPEETRFAHGTFWAEAGTTYLVSTLR